jgi:hypothetical protein
MARSRTDLVGPVLEAGPRALAVIDAIRAENAGVEVLDRNSYLRVLCPLRCAVSRTAIERFTGDAFRLPRDLESILLSFKGKFSVSEDRACWEFEPRGGPE